MSKTLIALVIVVALSLSVTGCTKKTGETANDAANATGEAVGNAAEATGEYLTQNKNEAVKAAQEKIALLDKKWQELQAKAAPTTDEAKVEFQNAKDQMAKTLAEAKTKLIEAKDAGADAWQKDVKPALDAALDKAQKLYEDTAAKFGSK
jgi:predicted small secreted protein